MTVAVARHLGRELPVDGVVCEEMREGRGIGDVVDGDDLQIGASLVGRAHEAAADAAEAVDGDAGGHGGSLVRRRYSEPTAAPHPRHPRSFRIAIRSSPPGGRCERGARSSRVLAPEVAIEAVVAAVKARIAALPQGEGAVAPDGGWLRRA
jgi:hypothetical protein